MSFWCLPWAGSIVGSSFSGDLEGGPSYSVALRGGGRLFLCDWWILDLALEEVLPLGSAVFTGLLLPVNKRY